MSAKLIYVLSSFHILFCAFCIHIHVKLIKLPLNLFSRIIDENQVIWQEISNIFPNKESIESLTTRHWEDKYFCTIWNIKWFKLHHGCILHSKIFRTSTHTPKSELNEEVMAPTSWRRKTSCCLETIATKQAVTSRELDRDPKNCVATKKLSRPGNLVTT